MLDIAIVQFTSTADVHRNLAICRSLAQRAADHGAEAVFYPECADIVFDENYDKEGERRDPKNIKAFVEGMREAAKEVRGDAAVASAGPDAVSSIAVLAVYLAWCAFRSERSWSEGLFPTWD